MKNVGLLDEAKKLFRGSNEQAIFDCNRQFLFLLGFFDNCEFIFFYFFQCLPLKDLSFLINYLHIALKYYFQQLADCSPAHLFANDQEL